MEVCVCGCVCAPRAVDGSVCVCGCVCAPRVVDGSVCLYLSFSQQFTIDCACQHVKKPKTRFWLSKTQFLIRGFLEGGPKGQKDPLDELGQKWLPNNTNHNKIQPFFCLPSKSDFIRIYSAQCVRTEWCLRTASSRWKCVCVCGCVCAPRVVDGSVCLYLSFIQQFTIDCGCQHVKKCFLLTYF